MRAILFLIALLVFVWADAQSDTDSDASTTVTGSTLATTIQTATQTGTGGTTHATTARAVTTALGTTIPVTTRIVTSTTPVPTPPPVTLPPEDPASVDIVFESFVQNELSTYTRALAVAVNISARRVTFVRHGDRAGYAFGNDQIVRVGILIRNFDDANEKTSRLARDQLVAIIKNTGELPKELQRAGVKLAYTVPDDPRLYTFKVYSNFDIVYTFIYVVTAVLYASFAGFVIFAFIRQCLTEGEDKKNEEKERKRMEAMKKESAAGRSRQLKNQDKAETFDRSDVDREMLSGVNSAAGRISRRLQLLELEDEREEQAKNLKAQMSPELEHFLNITTLPPPDDPTMDPFYRPMAVSRPPLVPISASDRDQSRMAASFGSPSAVSMDDL